MPRLQFDIPDSLDLELHKYINKLRSYILETHTNAPRPRTIAKHLIYPALIAWAAKHAPLKDITESAPNYIP